MRRPRLCRSLASTLGARQRAHEKSLRTALSGALISIADWRRMSCALQISNSGTCCKRRYLVQRARARATAGSTLADEWTKWLMHTRAHQLRQNDAQRCGMLPCAAAAATVAIIGHNSLAATRRCARANSSTGDTYGCCGDRSDFTRGCVTCAATGRRRRKRASAADIARRTKVLLL